MRVALGVLLALLLAAPARAVPPQPIPEGPDAGSLPVFSGQPATQRPVAVPDPPRHPFMAPNGRSNLHVDGYQSDVHQGPGPLGREMERRSTFLEGVCASVTFDSRGRIETVCVGVEGPKLLLLEPRTLETLAAMPLPPRVPGGGNLFTDFAGGGYFYLDHRDRAVIPTTSRHVYVVRQTGGGTGFELERDHDLSAAVLPGDKIISALPDWGGRLWFASTNGVVGTVSESGAVRSRPLGEKIANSFAVEDTGAVYIVTDAALYRLEAGADGIPQPVWRAPYENSGVQKPGQASAGSGTTPTLMGDGLVAITDNADPMNVLVHRRAGGGRICRQPVFEKGASATDQSLIGTGRRWWSRTTTATPARPRPRAGARPRPASSASTSTRAAAATRSGARPSARRRWCRSCRPATGSSTRTRRTRDPSVDSWYLTALDFGTGRTLYKRLAGEGLGYNNNYAPITLGPGRNRVRRPAGRARGAAGPRAAAGRGRAVGRDRRP